MISHGIRQRLPKIGIQSRLTFHRNLVCVLKNKYIQVAANRDDVRMVCHSEMSLGAEVQTIRPGIRDLNMASFECRLAHPFPKIEEEAGQLIVWWPD